MKGAFIALRALLYVTGFVFLWGWVALRLRAYDQGFENILPSWALVPGAIFMGLGGILVLACVGTFIVRGRGTPALFDAPRKFVAVGPYKHVRNPMYIGAWTLLVGFGLYLHSISILLFSLGWIVFFHLFVVFFEEPNLKDKFGVTYENYCTSVRRWLPRL